MRPVPSLQTAAHLPPTSAGTSPEKIGHIAHSVPTAPLHITPTKYWIPDCWSDPCITAVGAGSPQCRCASKPTATVMHAESEFMHNKHNKMHMPDYSCQCMATNSNLPAPNMAASHGVQASTVHLYTTRRGGHQVPYNTVHTLATLRS